MSVTHKRAEVVESGVVVLVDGSVQLKPFRQVWVGHKQSAIDHNINIARLLHGFISISMTVPSVWVKKLLLLASHAECWRDDCNPFCMSLCYGLWFVWCNTMQIQDIIQVVEKVGNVES